MFSKSDATLQSYTRLSDELADLPDVRIEEKKGSIHVVSGRAAFLGVHPRKEGLLLNIVLARPITDARIIKAEQVSRSRFHNELKISRPEEIDDTVIGWIREAHSIQTQ